MNWQDERRHLDQSFQIVTLQYRAWNRVEVSAVGPQ
jgi:hypothetical protein